MVDMSMVWLVLVESGAFDGLRVVTVGGLVALGALGMRWLVLIDTMGFRG